MNAVADVVRDWQAGMYALSDAFQAILDAASDVAVAEVVAEFPLELRDAFAAWLRRTYDNDVPAAGFGWVGPTQDPLERARSIERARRWLAQLDAEPLTPRGVNLRERRPRIAAAWPRPGTAGRVPSSPRGPCHAGACGRVSRGGHAMSKTIQVSTTPFKNGSYCDPESTDCAVEATLTFESADAGAVTCFTSIDGHDQAVFDRQESDGRFTAPTGGEAFTLLSSIAPGTTITITPQGATAKGTNGKVNVGTGSGDTVQVAH